MKDMFEEQEMTYVAIAVVLAVIGNDDLYG